MTTALSTTTAEFVTCPVLAALPKVKHGFFTRRGGVSPGIYAGLNVGYSSDDAVENVTRNRALAMQVLGAREDMLCTVSQVHSAKVVRVSEALHHKPAPEADGMVTNMSGVVLGILTADCAPVLFVDPVNKVIGAAHAGWKGAGLGICQETVSEMLKIGAETRHIHAAIGPCIHQESYEVGNEFWEKFHPVDREKFFIPGNRPEKFQFDLPGFVEKKLRELQLKSVTHVNRNTMTDETHFFSYRRKTIRNEPDYGRQLSAIMLTAL